MSLAIRCLFLLCFAVSLPAQSIEQKPRYALEVQYGEGSQPNFALVERGPGISQSATFFGPPLLPVTGKETGTDIQQKPCALSLININEAEDTVKFAAFFILEDCQSVKHGRLKGSESGQRIGEYGLHLYQSVVLDAMKQYGAQPCTIRVVPAQIVDPVKPDTMSNAVSLQFKVIGEDRHFYNLAVRNLSSQPVAGLVFGRGSMDHSDQFTFYSADKSLIAPGAEEQLRLGGKVDCAPPQSPSPEQFPCPIVLKGALFADGTHDGDVGDVASLEAGQLAAKTFRERIQELVKNTLADATLTDDAAKIAMLRSNLAQLTEEPDSVDMAELKLRYASLSDADWLRAKDSMKASVRGERMLLLSKLKDFESLAAGSSAGESLAQWFAHQGFGR